MDNYLIIALGVALAMTAALYFIPALRDKARYEFSSFDRNKAVVALLSISGGILTSTSAMKPEPTIESYLFAALSFFLILAGVGMLSAMFVGTNRKS